MIWDALVKVALIGTDRSELPLEEKEKLQSIGIETAKNPSETLLEAAAFYTPVRKAGYVLMDWSHPMPVTSTDDDLSPCSPKIMSFLKVILSGKYAVLIDEFIDLLRQYKKAIPAAVLPYFLNQSRIDPSLWDKIEPIIGSRGHWLIEQNPDWHFFRKELPDLDWHLASLEERVELLKLLRDLQPSQATILLQSTWAEEDHRSKAKFLKTLQKGLSKEDEDFLEICLDDSRKEVRKEAINLLAQIPGSAFENRMFERAKEQIKLKTYKSQKDKLTISLPDHLDEASLRDGLGSQKAKYSGGIPVNWLSQLISSVSPKKWEIHFKKKPRQILDLFVRSKWATPIFEALIQAAIRFDEHTWKEVLLEFILIHHEKPRWSTIKTEHLSRTLSAKGFNTVAISILKKQEELPDEEHPLCQLLKESQHPWEDQLFLLFLKKLQQWLSGGFSGYWEGWQYKAILKKASYYCSPNLVTTVKKNLEKPGRQWSGWEREIDQFIRTLQFRREMRAALKN